MSRRLVNALLLASIAALVLTGALGWLVHDAWVAPAVASHRLVGIAVVLALLWKGRIVLASLRRRVRTGDRSIALGSIAAACLLVGEVGRSPRRELISARSSLAPPCR